MHPNVQIKERAIKAVCVRVKIVDAMEGKMCALGRAIVVWMVVSSAAFVTAQPRDQSHRCHWPQTSNGCDRVCPANEYRPGDWRHHVPAANSSTSFPSASSSPSRVTCQPGRTMTNNVPSCDLPSISVPRYFTDLQGSESVCQGGQIVDHRDAATLGRGLSGIRTSGLFGGFEFLWIRPTFDQNVALIIDPPVGNTSVPFDYSMDLSARAWAGYQSCSGFGFAATYFQFDDAAPTESVTAVTGATPVFVFVSGAGGNLTRNANANVGQTLVSNHSLDLQSLDLEATQVFRFQQLRAMLGFGVRVGDIEQHFRGNVFNPSGTLEEAVSNDLEFAGAGPTLSAHVTRSLGETRFALHGSARGSLLVGTMTQRIYEMKGAFTTELEDIAEQRETLGIFELGLGLQYGQSLGRSSGMFVRVGYEAQIWMDAGGPVDSDSTIGLAGVTLATGINF